MKISEVLHIVNMKFGTELAMQNLYDWERKGLIGKVGKKISGNLKSNGQRDYSTTNLNQIIIVTLLKSWGKSENYISQVVIDKKPEFIEDFKNKLHNFNEFGFVTLKELENNLDNLLQ